MAAVETPRLNYDVARDIFQAISASRCQVQWQDLVDRAIAYARIRVDWLRAEPAQQDELGPRRTAHHDAFIEACQAMVAAQASAGEDVRWQTLLGTDRKSIGDFACFVHCMLGVIAR
jgi:hypothetical protein